jgi:hypothetical protein
VVHEHPRLTSSPRRPDLATDFDPAAVPRRKMPKNQQIVVRMMLPMSIQCNTCGNFLYKGASASPSPFAL